MASFSSASPDTSPPLHDPARADAQPDGAIAMPQVYHISPLIRLTLLSLYVALTCPLPILAQVTQAPVPPSVLAGSLALGAIALFGVLSERVILTETSITVTSPRWIPGWIKRGWSLEWSHIQALKPRSTGQGGIVYYFVGDRGEGGDRQVAYLLPMRVAGFAALVRQVQARTGIDTTDVRPLSQPWMYFILLGCTGLLLLTDAWVFSVALTQGLPG